MKQFKMFCFVGLSLFIFVGLLSLTSSTVKAKEILSVLVENTEAQPVPVKDVNASSKLPVVFECNITLPPGTATGDGGCSPFVPTDKTLVVEFVTIRADLPTGQEAEVIIQTGAFILGDLNSTGQSNHRIAFTSGPVEPTTLTDQYFATHLVKMYAIPGDNIGFHLGRNSTVDQAFATISISGYLTASL